MNSKLFSRPVSLKNVRLTASFWTHEMEMVRTEMIPYQWEALNDRIPDAEPSWCMHNFRAAARLNARKKAGQASDPSGMTFRGVQVLPEDPAHPDEDRFYGFVFQDSDLSKWLEAVAYTLTWHPDPELEKTADETIDLICRAQAEDGYLDTCFILQGRDRSFTNLKDYHELYCFGHLAEAAVAYYQATGKDRLLKAACRYADCIARHIGPEEGKLRGYPGHEIAEMALVRLYEVTGEQKYLDQCRYFIDQRGQEPLFFAQEEKARGVKRGPGYPRLDIVDYAYHQAHKPVRMQDEAVGHAVRAMYLYSGMADTARLTGDEELAAACEKLWNSTTREKLYITGGVGGTEIGESFSYPYDLPNDSAYSETCAAIGLVFFARRMLQMKPDSRYADVMEMALCNTVLAGVAMDGRSFFYVNPLEVVPQACHQDLRLHHVMPVRQKWFGCACCPPNAARLISSVGGYAWTANEDTLFTHLYLTGSADAELNGGKLTLEVQSDVQEGAGARMTVHAAAPVHCTLAFRLPGWCRNPAIICEGRERREQDGYVYLTGDWKDGDTVLLTAPADVRLRSACHRVREDEGCVALTRGTITYCAEEADNGPDLHLVRICPEDLGENNANVKTETVTICGMDVTALKVPARRVVPAQTDLYDDWQPEKTEPFTLTMIPYAFWANRGEGEMRVWLKTL